MKRSISEAETTGTSTITPDIVEQQQQYTNNKGYELDPFETFAADRIWKYSEGFWSRLIQNSASYGLPDYVIGDVSGLYNATCYGVTNLAPIHEAGCKAEFSSKDYRYQKRQTFALRIGYDGNQYYGYQQQKVCPGLTVEGDLKLCLGVNTVGAGRTDRGVSAVSQVICFPTNNMNMTAQDVLTKFREADPVKEGRLAVYECLRVPKKFQSRASATWRRYLYMFPLNRLTPAEVKSAGKEGGGAMDEYDVDVTYLNELLRQLEGKDLPYNAYAYMEDRVSGQGLLDHCTLIKLRATVVNLADAVPGVPWAPIPETIKFKNNAVVPDPVPPLLAEDNRATTTTSSVVSTVVEEAAKSITQNDTTGITSSTLTSANSSSHGLSGDLPAPLYAGGGQSIAKLQELKGLPKGKHYDTDENDLPAICIELVGSRFLRRMVRILTATAIREAIKSEEERNVNILGEICLSGDRSRAARALPGPPLCLAGVGYDADDMAIYKFMPKKEYNARMSERSASSEV